MSLSERGIPARPVPRIVLGAVCLIGLAIFAGAWGYFVLTFGWVVGGALGWWPATLMGAGAALLLALGITPRPVSNRRALDVETRKSAEAREI